MKAVLFSRVSTKEQAEEGYSLDAQTKLLKDYASKREFRIARSFEIPESASGKQERTQFNEMLEYLRKNPEVKILLAEKVDRISRNFKDGAKLDDWLHEDEARQIHFVKQSLIIHKNSRSHEKFQWDIYLVMARQYSNNLSEETRKGLSEKAAQGHYPGGGRKRGYRSIGDAGHKRWIMDSSPTSEAPYIKRTFELFDSGKFTIDTIRHRMFDEGWKSSVGKPIAKSEIHLLLTDPFFCGDFVWGGVLHKNAKHEPLISKEVFERVQERIKRKITGKYRKHSFLLSELITCGECGRSVVAEVQKGHNYYHCTKFARNCAQKKYAREEALENQLLAKIDGLHVTNQRLADWIKKALRESHADEMVYRNEILTELNSRHTRTLQKLDALYDDKLEGTITPEFYKGKFKQISEEIENIAATIQRHTKASVNYIELGVTILELSQSARALYLKKREPADKRALLSLLFSNVTLKDGIITTQYHKAFELIAEKSNTLNTLPVNFEPSIIYSAKAKTAVFAADSHTILGD